MMNNIDHNITHHCFDFFGKLFVECPTTLNISLESDLFRLTIQC